MRSTAIEGKALGIRANAVAPGAIDTPMFWTSPNIASGEEKVPDDMLGQIMMILIGSESAAAPLMPAPDTHRQLRKALKFGPPIWWTLFKRHYRIEMVARPMRRDIPLRDRATAAAGTI